MGEEAATSPAIETDVLIVGSGPAGASLACFLSYYGITGLMISRDKHTAPQPRAHVTNMAAFECLRDIELEQEFRQAGVGREFYGEYRYCYSLMGQDIMAMPGPGVQPERRGDYEEASPCEHADVGQNVGEPVLHRFATTHGFQSRFNCKFLQYEEDQATGLITSTVQDQLTGVTFRVVSKYLCAADGANSTVARQAGIAFNTLSGGAQAMNVWYEADLTHIYGERPGLLSTIISPDVDAPLWAVYGMNRVVRPFTEHIMGLLAHPSVTAIEATEEQILKRVRELIGDPDVEIRVKGMYKWKINESYAEVASKGGNVFFLGDAISRHSPGKGLGSNSCIQDAYNLAWKLAYVLQGRASARLLDSYSPERQPVAKRVTRTANDTIRLQGALFQALGTAAPTASERMAALAELEQATPAGAARRAALKKARTALFDESSALGAEMNQAYHSAAVFLDDEVNPNPTWPEGPRGVQHHFISTYPGSRLPHAWLYRARDAKRLSTHDLAGKGHFTLFTGVGGAHAWTDAAERAAKRLGGNVQVVVRTVGHGQEFLDPHFMWEERRAVGEDGAILVRPDRTVAWRSQGLDGGFDPEKLGTVLLKILGRD